MSTADHNAYQLEYYSRPDRKPRMRPSRSRYVLRHLRHTLRAVGLEKASKGRVLEIGCGMGRFTRLLVEQGFDVTAVDLSPDLLEQLGRETAGDGDGQLRTICCDAAEMHRHVDGPFDAVLGFFFLHHLDNLRPTLQSVLDILRPGGWVAFCEPNAFHLPFYLQILLTPGMTWKGDRGILRMRPTLLHDALKGAGFIAPKIERYGMFPPAISNRAPGAALEEWLERRRSLRSVQAFQVISAARADV